jgi:hypothetical protein
VHNRQARQNLKILERLREDGRQNLEILERLQRLEDGMGEGSSWSSLVCPLRGLDNINGIK